MMKFHACASFVPHVSLKLSTLTFEEGLIGHDLDTGVVVCGAGPLGPQLSGRLPRPQPPALVTHLTVHGLQTEATQTPQGLLHKAE